MQQPHAAARPSPRPQLLIHIGSPPAAPSSVNKLLRFAALPCFRRSLLLCLPECHPQRSEDLLFPVAASSATPHPAQNPTPADHPSPLQSPDTQYKPAAPPPPASAQTPKHPPPAPPSSAASQSAFVPAAAHRSHSHPDPHTSVSASVRGIGVAVITSTSGSLLRPRLLHQPKPLLHAKPMLLIHNHQPQILEVHLVFNQRMRPNRQIRLAAKDPAPRLAFRRLIQRPRQQRHPIRLARRGESTSPSSFRAER